MGRDSLRDTFLLLFFFIYSFVDSSCSIRTVSLSFGARVLLQGSEERGVRRHSGDLYIQQQSFQSLSEQASYILSSHPASQRGSKLTYVATYRHTDGMVGLRSRTLSPFSTSSSSKRQLTALRRQLMPESPFQDAPQCFSATYVRTYVPRQVALAHISLIATLHAKRLVAWKEWRGGKEGEVFGEGDGERWGLSLFLSIITVSQAVSIRHGSNDWIGSNRLMLFHGFLDASDTEWSAPLGGVPCIKPRMGISSHPHE